MNAKIQVLQDTLQAATDPEDRADLMSKLALELRESDPGQALAMAQQCLDYAEQHQLIKGTAYGMRTLGACQLQLSRYQEALNNSLAAVKLLEALGDRHSVNRVLNIIGNIYRHLGDYDKASEYYFSVLRTSQELHDDLMVASAYNNLGNLYHALNDLKAALEYYSQGLELFERLGESKFYDVTLMNVAGIHRTMGDLGRSLENYSRALELMEKHGDSYNQAAALTNMGYVYLDLGEKAEAQNSWERALALAQRTSNAEAEISARVNLAGLLLLDRRTDMALQQLDTAMAVAQDHESQHSLREILSQYIKAHEQAGDYRQALAHYRRFHELEQNLLNAQKEERVRNLQISYEVEQARKEAEIYRLQNVELTRAYKELEALSSSYDRLTQANIELVELDRLKTEFVANVSHELKTPLTAISGYVDHLASGKSGPFSETQSRIIGSIKANVQRLTRQIKDLLDFMAMEAGRFAITAKPFALQQLLDEVAANHHIAAESKGLQLIVRDTGGLLVNADRERIFQVVENLATNAVKFTDQGMVTLSARSSPDGVVLSVSDTGIGIPQQSLGRIFERFHQVDGSATRRHGGVGLGLAIVKSILDAHHAPITVESTPGQGTTFTFVLPAA